MAIHIHTEHPHYKHKRINQTKAWFKNVILDEKKIPGDINIVFMGDEDLIKINVEYLKQDYYTDVICFNYNSEKVISGDIFISYDRIVENSDEFRAEIINEVYRVMVHGLLHLLGYNDKFENEIRKIREKENYYLNRIINPDSK